MKFMTILMIGLFMSGFGNTQAQETNPENANKTQESSNPIIGIWEMTINAPGGKDKGILTFYDDSGELKVKNDKGSYNVSDSGSNYNWPMTKKTPMGEMDFKVKATIDGNKMSGTMEMVSGMAAGRKVDFTASRK